MTFAIAVILCVAQLVSLIFHHVHNAKLNAIADMVDAGKAKLESSTK